MLNFKQQQKGILDGFHFVGKGKEKSTDSPENCLDYFQNNQTCFES